jgi:hypothetical protein
MKLARVLLFLWLVAAFVLPCAAQDGRVKNHAGLHPVRDAGGKWGFIDRTGRFRIPPRYDGAGEFSEGVAYAWFWEGGRRKDGIVDAGGRFTELPAVNDYEFIFHDGLARFQTPTGEERKYGYMDKTGRVVIPPQFDDSGHFSEGLAWVSVFNERKRLYGFINKTGKIVIKPQFVYQPGDFVDGLAKVVGQTSSGFIDHTGSFRIKVESERSDDFFSEGLAPVLSFNKLGFIDRTGKVVVEPMFRETSGFSEGLAAVKIIGSDGQYVWGYIDHAGRFAIAPRFREAHPFAGGLAQVATAEGKEQLIDGTGKVICQH